jgi:hypothetical protein
MTVLPIRVPRRVAGPARAQRVVHCVRYMLRRIVVLAIFAAAASVIAGCGHSAQTADCGILANGTKLCGSDLTSYCKKFEEGSLDQSTVQVCEEAGVDVLSNLPTPPSSSTLERECDNAGGKHAECEEWTNSEQAVGVERISPDAANCIATGGRVRYCVSDEAP